MMRRVCRDRGWIFLVATFPALAAAITASSLFSLPAHALPTGILVANALGSSYAPGTTGLMEHETGIEPATSTLARARDRKK